MASRGRGGRGGRGRGMSFNVEALGFGIGESLPGPVLTPPNLFPPLTNPPLPLREEDKRNSSFSGKVDWDYCVMVKKGLVDWLWDVSPFSNIIGGPNNDTGKAVANPVSLGVERYSDKYLLPQTPSDKDSSCFDWKRLPKELRPGVVTKGGKRAAGAGPKEGVKRKKVQQGKVAPARKGDLEKRLAELERREGEDDVEEGEGGGEKTREGGEGEEGAEGEREAGEGGDDDEELEEEDEEMDDGTDYISSYFDNGEGYLDDDDDNGDDGPTY